MKVWVNKMIPITYDLIMSFDPCYDPIKIRMPKDYKASPREFIKEWRNKVKNRSDILWILLRHDFFNDRDLRLFAVWCAQQAKNYRKDDCSLNALLIAEKFAFGKASVKELSAASEAAWDTAWASGSAARAAAWTAWEDALDAAVEAACEAASYATVEAAMYATVQDAWDAQIDILLQIIDKPNGKWFKRHEM